MSAIQTHGFYSGQVVVFLESFKLFIGSVENWKWKKIKKGSKATVASTHYGLCPWHDDWAEKECALKIDYIDGYREFRVPMDVLEPENTLERMAMALTERPVDPLVEAVKAFRDDQIGTKPKGRRPR
jgi:hypothetical protein